MTDQTGTQRAFTAILRHFVTAGRAPHYTELADILDVGVDEARDLAAAGRGRGSDRQLLAGS